MRALADTRPANPVETRPTRSPAGECDVTVEGVNVSEANIGHARAAVAAAERHRRVHFQLGDAEDLRLRDNAFDGPVCECPLCMLPDEDAARRFPRILRPGGLAGITDVTITDAGLPAELTAPAARVACIADTRSVPAYTETLAGAGPHVRHTPRLTTTAR
ncbi:methyltransferase domain-containing protein [Mycobacterium sp. Lab-001]|uniref:methyltransferase domain-containing protein n=1 Tax=Mycobacterium sp. Lab-001 TaxID=3410136 RepID=UPI003D16A8CA